MEEESDIEGEAMHFSRVDLEYFQENTEKSLIPQNRERFVDLCFFIVNEAPPRNPFYGNKPVVIPQGIVPKTLNWNSKEAADLFHASLTQKYDYLKFEYGIDLLAKNSNGEYIYSAEQRNLMVDGSLLLGGEPREYSNRKIIEPAVLKLTRCHANYFKDYGETVFYVESNPFYDYSLTGLFNLSNFGEGSTIGEKDRDFFFF